MHHQLILYQIYQMYQGQVVNKIVVPFINLYKLDKVLYLISLVKTHFIFIASNKAFLLVCSNISRSCVIKGSFSGRLRFVKYHHQESCQKLGIGTVPYLLRMIPNNSLVSANPYFLIHCLPTSFIN